MKAWIDEAREGSLEAARIWRAKKTITLTQRDDLLRAWVTALTQAWPSNADVERLTRAAVRYDYSLARMLADGVKVFPDYPDDSYGRRDRGWFRRLFVWRPDIVGVETPEATPYRWQIEIMDDPLHALVAIGRQSGKTQTGSGWAVEEGFHHAYPDETVVISKSREQAGIMFDRMRWIVQLNDLLAWSAFRITDTLILLDSGAKIYSRPAGMTGDSTRGIRPKRCLMDECAYIPDQVYNVVRPSVIRTKGRIVLLSTPAGKVGFFYHIHDRGSASWRKFQIPSWEVPGVTREECLEAAEESGMGDVMFRQEYGAEFIDVGHNAFRQALIDALYHDAPPVNPVGTPGVLYDAGMDIGTSVDSTVLVVNHQDYKTGHITVDYAKEWTPPNNLHDIATELATQILPLYPLRHLILPSLGRGDTLGALLPPDYQRHVTLVPESIQMKTDLYLLTKRLMEAYRVHVPAEYPPLGRQMLNLIIEPSDHYGGKFKIGHPYSHDNQTSRGHKYHDDWYDAFTLSLYPHLTTPRTLTPLIRLLTPPPRPSITLGGPPH